MESNRKSRGRGVCAKVVAMGTRGAVFLEQELWESWRVLELS